ncbi:MAG: GNAT family N-acetyltransferase [Planctomycetota bacterium]|jgi:ribosomal-protein-alanine N-acetyltransferase
MPDDRSASHDRSASRTLETERLVLRPLEDGDAEFVFRHFSDPDVTRHLLDSPPLREQSEAKEMIRFYKTYEAGRANRWCIVRKADKTAIGTCGFHCHALPHRRAEIGYDLGPSAWGQGFMTEALGAALDHGFGPMGLHRIEAIVFRDNVRSVRLLARLGFQPEGTLRDYLLHDGEFFDHTLYALLGEEWASR